MSFCLWLDSLLYSSCQRPIYLSINFFIRTLNVMGAVFKCSSYFDLWSLLKIFQYFCSLSNSGHIYFEKKNYFSLLKSLNFGPLKPYAPSLYVLIEKECCMSGYYLICAGNNDKRVAKNKRLITSVP